VVGKNDGAGLSGGPFERCHLAANRLHAERTGQPAHAAGPAAGRDHDLPGVDPTRGRARGDGAIARDQHLLDALAAPQGGATRGGAADERINQGGWLQCAVFRRQVCTQCFRGDAGTAFPELVGAQPVHREALLALPRDVAFQPVGVRRGEGHLRPPARCRRSRARSRSRSPLRGPGPARDTGRAPGSGGSAADPGRGCRPGVRACRRTPRWPPPRRCPRRSAARVARPRPARGRRRRQRCRRPRSACRGAPCRSACDETAAAVASYG